MVNNKVAVFFPIKEHSERIPNKNFTIINGTPLHNILVSRLMDAEFVGTIYINTDSPKIADYYKGVNNVKIIPRKKEVIGDYVSMNDVIRSSLDDIKEDVILQTHVTNPMVKLETFKDAVDTYFQQIKFGYDSLFSVTKYFKRFFDTDFRPVNHDPRKLLRTQDLNPLYVENSCIYLISKKEFEENNSRIGNKPYLFEMGEYEALDIDWPEDLEIIHKLLA